MDFEKIKAAAEEIKLSDADKEKIILMCEESKKNKKKSRFVPIAAAAAVAVFAFVIFSPGFLFRAKEADNYAPQENAAADYELLADSYDGAQGVINQSSSTENSDFKNDGGGADLLPRKYRNNYYSIPASFIKIVGKSAYEEWEDAYLAKNYPDNSNEMVMVAYVKAFNISKKDFERANLNYANFINEHYSHICLNPQDYADQEMQEIYNADIIYTFDNQIINDYYLGIDYPFLNEYQYDEAVANGTYETRTTEFIDIEQMEAEIIAKYGEAEIVTQ